MRLKKLEMHGFKSFVDPTVVKLDPGITAIVGPNGCGKSNVSDSIRWVLGEKSAKALRGSKMMDVVFNGTEERKPSGMAEVTLTFDNEDRKLPSDYAEVSVSRRQYRSGETEYMINKATCRLKDISNLFADTGIGTDGYSVLEQGKMDMILSSKPMERRSVFEEAAGITRYKTQRDEAGRKLAATEDNLDRVNLIVSEVKRQINSLERQAKKAEKYRELKEEMDALQSRLLVKEYRARLERQNQVESILREINQEADDIEASLREKEGRSSELQLTLTQDEEALSSASEAVHRLETQAAQADRQLEVNRTQIGALKDRVERAKKDAEAFRLRQSELNGELESSKNKVSDAQRRLSTLATELQALEAELNNKTESRLKLSEDSQKLQQKGLDLVNRRSEVRGEGEAIQGKLSIVEERSKQLREELLADKEALQQAGQVVEEATKAVGGKQEEVKSLQGVLGGKYSRSQYLEKSFQEKETRISDMQVALSSLEGRRKLLEELAKALEGFEAGPKALLLQGKKDGTQFANVQSLSQKVKTDPKFETAVELALGRQLQLILCGSPEEARLAIAWLKDQKAGRATLMPFGHEVNVSRDFPSELLAETGVLGVLADKIQSEEGLRPLVEWLAGSHLLVEDLDAALNLRTRLPKHTVAVTLAGDMVHAHGMITGGSQDTASRGLLGRDRELSEMHVEMSGLRDEIAIKEKERDTLREEFKRLKSEIESDSTNLKDVQIEIAQLEKEASSRREDQRRRTQEHEDKQRAISEADAQANGYRSRAKELEALLGKMAAEEQSLQSQQEAALDSIEKARMGEKDLQAAVSEKRVNQAQIKQGLENDQSSVQRLVSEVENQGNQARMRDQEAANAETERDKLDTENRGLEQKLKSLYEQKDEAQSSVTKAAETKTSHQAEMSALEKELKESRRKFGELGDQRHTRQMEVQEIKLDRGKINETLMREYNLNMDNDQQEDLNLEEEVSEDGKPQSLSEEEQAERVADLKTRLTNLGVVNPAAAEEYRELEQRHSLLVGQVEDLKKAKNDLQKVIGKINQTTQERFQETFDKVHENFKQVFRMLFGGGEAKLILHEDPNGEEEAGIEIVARPPGKRQQNISLLSGGERSMTAIALLFSLFQHKPSPFCVLDEIDAPLDDANIGRFTQMLTEFGKISQFIVITHSKITMEKAAALYGVTMEERGVSSVVSVRFKEEESKAVSS